MIKAVAFDIDGTLYPNYKMFVHTASSFFLHPRLVKAFSRVRKEIRKNPPFDGEPLRTRQTQLVAKELGISLQKAGFLVDNKLYGRWVTSFKKLKAFKGVESLLFQLKSKGLPLAVMSDFPVEKKLVYMGIDDYFKVKLCSEDCGRLKPDAKPFLFLQKELDIPAEDILFVGNSYRYDIVGAKNAGMQTAYIVNSRKKKKNLYEKADFIFSSYKELETILCKK
ncbi:MAG: HAD family hydrolase [Spirochaetales bacterium]|nr:HAD family hydrolase [Spirochaetales bacterium]